MKRANSDNSPLKKEKKVRSIDLPVRGKVSSADIRAKKSQSSQLLMRGPLEYSSLSSSSPLKLNSIDLNVKKNFESPSRHH